MAEQMCLVRSELHILKEQILMQVTPNHWIDEGENQPEFPTLTCRKGRE